MCWESSCISLGYVQVHCACTRTELTVRVTSLGKIVKSCPQALTLSSGKIQYLLGVMKMTLNLPFVILDIHCTA